MRILTLMALCISCVCSTAPAETLLTVMSFNFRHGLGMDGKNSWPYRKDLFAAALRHCDADVFGSQECLAFQGEFILYNLPEYAMIARGREADGGGEMAAVFYKKTVLTPIDSGHFWISETPEVPGSRSWNTACTRMATWVHFRHIASNIEFWVFNTHLDHVSEEARQQGARIILDRMKAADARVPVILTGDFNSDAETSAPWKILTDNGLADAWLKAEKRIGPDQTFGNFAPPQGTPKSRIDWILTRNIPQVRQCETVLYNQDNRYPSDHYSVLAKLVLIP